MVFGSTRNQPRRRRIFRSVDSFLVLSAFLFTFAFTGVAATIVKTTDTKDVVRYRDVVNAGSLGDPLSGASSCTPGRSGRATFVCDASALLAPRSANRIDQEISSIYSAQGRYKRAVCNGSTMKYGYLIEVAVVRRMESGPRSASSFAGTLFRNWKVGDSQTTCGNGVLILVSLEDRKYYFATGNSVQRVMNRHSSNKVEQALVKYLKRNNVYMAVLNAVMVLGKELASNTRGGGGGGNSPPAYVPPTNNYGDNDNYGKQQEENGPWSMIVFIIVCLLGSALCFAACNGVGGKEAALRKKRVRAATKKLNMIKQEYEAAALPQYIPISCSITSESLFPKVTPTAAEQAKLDENDPLVEKYRGPVRTLRCGHRFFESVLEKHVPSLDNPVCPVCSDSETALGTPPTLAESRDRDFTFRLANLREEYPDIITDSVHQRLLNPNATATRVGTQLPPGADDGNYGNINNNRTSGPAWGQLAGAAGVGALTAWGLGSIFGGRNHNNYGSYYDNNNYHHQNNNWGGFEDWTGGWGSGNDSGGAPSRLFGNSGNDSGWGGGNGGGWGDSGGGWGSGGGGDDNSGFGGGW